MFATTKPPYYGPKIRCLQLRILDEILRRVLRSSFSSLSPLRTNRLFYKKDNTMWMVERVGYRRKRKTWTREEGGGKEGIRKLMKYWRAA